MAPCLPPTGPSASPASPRLGLAGAAQPSTPYPCPTLSAPPSPVRTTCRHAGDGSAARPGRGPSPQGAGLLPMAGASQGGTWGCFCSPIARGNCCRAWGPALVPVPSPHNHHAGAALPTAPGSTAISSGDAVPPPSPDAGSPLQTPERRGGVPCPTAPPQHTVLHPPLLLCCFVTTIKWVGVDSAVRPSP